jgi:DNA-binding LacI/PurR family transcriptional regulator
VINGSPSVKASTRRLVLDAIARLDFHPNRAARALAGGPVQSVTVLTANTRRYGFVGTLEGIEEAARVAGFAVGVRVVEPGSPGAVKDAVDRAIELAGALIVVAFDLPSIVALDAVPADVPMAAIVETPRGAEAEGKPWVWIDDRKAATDSTNYLLSLGHKTVHYISLPATRDDTQRMLGWRSALEAAGVEAPEPLQGGWGPRSGFEAAKGLVGDAKVTALLCGNDDLAIGAMRAMHMARRTVPESISIVGFDDIPLAAYCSPALTTVRQDFAALGRLCFARLLSLLNPGTAIDEPNWPQAELVVRESAGPAPRSQPGSVRPRRHPAAGSSPLRPNRPWPPWTPLVAP